MRDIRRKYSSLLLYRFRGCTRTYAHTLENDRVRSREREKRRKEGKKEIREEEKERNASLELSTITTIDPSRVGWIHARMDKESVADINSGTRVSRVREQENGGEREREREREREEL